VQKPVSSDRIISPSVVYIVDADAGVRRSLSALLTAAGLQHHCYELAGDFLRQYEDRGPACVVTDVRMPDLSGIQLLERMRSVGCQHPAIVMTAFNEVDTVIRAFRHGALDVFEKPVSGSLLLERIQSAIERDREQRSRRDRAAELRIKLATLSRREHQVMGLLIEGLPNKEIAWQLKLSDKTVAAHRANLLGKMQVDSLAKLISNVVRFDPEGHWVAADPGLTPAAA